MATAHFGNWDMAGALVARHLPLSAVVETFSDERLNQLVQNQRRERGLGIIPMEGSAPPHFTCPTTESARCHRRRSTCHAR